MRRKTIPVEMTLSDDSSISVTASFLESGCGPTVILLHGFLSTAQTWRPLIQYLQTNFRCIAVDLLGFGASSKPEISYTVSEQVQFVHHLVQSLGIQNYFVIGHSLGGWIAASYALTYPNAILGLTLLAPAGISEELHRYQPLKLLAWPSPAIDLILKGFQTIASVVGKPDIISVGQRYRHLLLFHPVIKVWFQRIFKNEMSSELVADQITAILAPTFIIIGDCDQTIPLWYCEVYAERIPQASLKIIAGADHALPTNQTEALHDLFSDFADDCLNALNRLR